MKWSRRAVMGGVAAAALASRLDLAGATGMLSGNTATMTVSTRFGRVRGLRVGDVCAYRGIPYGGSTDGRDRFGPPRPPDAWRGVLDAFDCGPPCLQVNTDLPAWVDPRPQNESCLFLNVWTPEPAPSGRHPVMVWIHGGAYVSGSGGLAIYDGSALARRGAVVVTVNHRLGPFGYLYLGSLGERYVRSANVGQLDLVAALQWVRENIEAFGGDPGNVTVFGESGGGGKITALSMMPAARGLFHKAIIESGSIWNTIDAAAAHRIASAVLAKLAIDPRHSDKLLETPPLLLLDAANSVLQDMGNPLGLSPVLDGAVIAHDSWTQGAPTQVAAIPFLIGTNLDEAAYFIGDPVTEPASDAALRRRLSEAGRFIGGLTSEHADALIQSYRRLDGSSDRLELLIRIATDMFLWRDAVTQAEHKVRQHAAPVYMYEFTWRTPCFGRRWAPHGSEIPFVFGNLDYWFAWDWDDTPAVRAAADPGRMRDRLSTKMMDAWIAFARTGNPGTPSLPQWPEYELTHRATMELGASCSVIENPRGAERALLDRILASRTTA